MKKAIFWKTLAGWLLAALLVLPAAAQGQGAKQPIVGNYCPYLGEDYPKNVYWGDTHVHTSYSFDAGVILDLGPDAAYRFARGEEITAQGGMKVKLIRPLDFLVVSDHAEYLGITPRIKAGDPVVLKDPVAQRWAGRFAKGTFEDVYAVFMDMVTSIYEDKELIQDKAIKQSAWEYILDTAEKFNDPGNFTAFVGFEWTSMPNGNNLHRNVIFKEGKAKAGQVLPFSLFDSEDPEDLWKYMENYEKKTGGEVLAIPHNGNLSNGLMFPLTDSKGNPLSRAYAEARARWEPLVEATQIKGDSETHPVLSPGDEFADFETWDKSNLMGTAPKEKWMLQYEYVRSALKLGLQIEEKTGANPYKFGMIGSTDTHTALSTAREANFWGKHVGVEPSPNRMNVPIIRSKVDPKLSSFGRDMSAAGYAGVWATENTRAALFDAMKRREVYASTGPRMTVRFFGGWDFAGADATGPDFVDTGYGKGVPMGGDLPRASAGKAPTFLVSALKDPDGANLDRIQIIKGWLDKKGKLREKVYDVALSDGRRVGRDGKVRPVGNTVDVANATYTNTIGDAQLAAFWRDPDFDAKERAFYYARVIEIPTPRWPAYDAKFFHIKMPEGTRMVTQDRAYTSPIWYTPAN